MREKFNEEINIISNNNFNNELLLFSLYYEIYYLIIGKLDFNNEELGYYEKILKSRFKEIIPPVNSPKQKENPRILIEEYLSLLSVSPEFSSAKNSINYYMNNLQELIDKMPWINIIDKFNMGFPRKADLIIIYREHINNIYQAWISYYGNIETYDIRKSITDELTPSIYNILSSMYGVYDLNSFLIRIKEKTKKIVDNIDLEDLELDNTLVNFITSLTEDEKNFFMLTIIYSLSGYEKSDTRVIRKEIFAKNDISTLYYLKMSASVAIKYSKWMKDNKNVNELKFFKK